jgi:hypothetical protein
MLTAFPIECGIFSWFSCRCNGLLFSYGPGPLPVQGNTLGGASQQGYVVAIYLGFRRPECDYSEIAEISN